MQDATLLQDLGIILLAAALFSALARPARIPSIVAFILAGLALGPVGGILTVSDAVHLAAEVGIALLLFLVGLELSIAKVRDIGKLAFAAGGAQMGLTSAAILGVALLMGFGTADAVFLAVALSFSSTVVVVKLLTQSGELDTPHGQASIGVLLVQDLVVVMVLTFVAGLGRGGELEVGAVLKGLALAFSGMAVLVGIAAAASRWLLPPLFHWISRGSSEALFIWAIAWCFLLIEGAVALSLSLEMGAFLAGMTLAQLPYNHEMRRRVEPLMNFFVAVFFVALGVQIELEAVGEVWKAAVVFSLLTLLGKPLLFTWLLPRLGLSKRDGVRTGLTLAQSSEFSFILAALALSTSLVSSELVALISMVGLITMGISSYFILYSEGLSVPLLRFVTSLPGFGEGGGKVSSPHASPPPGSVGHTVYSHHIIVVGMNSLGRRLARELSERGEEVVAIDSDPGKLQDLPCPTLLGNAEHLSVLAEAGLDRARLLVSALHIEETNNLLTYRARSRDIPVSVHAFDTGVVPDLESLGATHLMVGRDLGAERLLAAVRDRGAFQS